MGIPLPPVQNNMLDIIGNTPVVKLNKIIPNDHADVYIKLEYYSPTGSYKDRSKRTANSRCVIKIM